MSDLENLRHAETRGVMLNILAQDYNSEMTSIGTLMRALDARGFSLLPETLAFHLRYLADQNYLKIWRSKDLPGFRSDRLTAGARSDDLRFARILPLGIQLVDGDCAADPKVKF